MLVLFETSAGYAIFKVCFFFSTRKQNVFFSFLLIRNVLVTRWEKITRNEKSLRRFRIAGQSSESLKINSFWEIRRHDSSVGRSNGDSRRKNFETIEKIIKTSRWSGCSRSIVSRWFCTWQSDQSSRKSKRKILSLICFLKEKFSFECVCNSSVQDLMRVIRSQADSLLQVDEKELAAMRIGLAHSLSRYKLKFSPDKVDTMIVQAICKSKEKNATTRTRF